MNHRLCYIVAMPVKMNRTMKEKLSPQRKLIVIWTVAIILPIIVLIVFEYISLSNIKSTHAIDAVIQRDFLQTLKVVERRSNDQLNIYARTLAGKLGDADLSRLSQSQVEEKINTALRYFSFPDAVFYYSDRRGLMINDRESLAAHAPCDSLSVNKASVEELLKSEHFISGVRMLRSLADKGDFQIAASPFRRNEEDQVRIVVYFPLPPFEGDPVQMGGYVLNTSFLSKDFFPEIFREMETASMSGERHDLRSTIIAIHYINQPEKIIASSQPIDSYDFDVKRMMGGSGAWRFFISEIKPKGSTIESISDRYLRWNFLLVTLMVMVLIVGMMLTLRNMSREMQLAQLKSDFVSNVSHELKTPLALIRLFAETLELDRVKDPERQKEYFGTIRKESERLTLLINNILDFSRIEAGKREYKFARENVGEMVRETLESYRFHVEQLGFAMTVRIDDSIPRLSIDRDAMSQAVLNLLNNALKYSQDEKHIAVDVWRDERLVKISVADRGIGIARADQKKIFEKFYRASNSLVHDNKGSGLGLSLVQHIVHAHGGTIKVESRVGEGSRFTIQLPVSESDLTGPTTSVPAEELRAETFTHKEGAA